MNNILYDSIEYLNKGTYNEVYLVKYQNINFIIKYQDIQNNKNILYYEYILLSNIFNNHNNIVKLYSNNSKNYFYEKDKYAILLEEYLNYTLDLKKEKYIFLINDILDIAIQLIKTIKYIHSNKYLYIDLKPQNIMFIDDNTMNIKLVDFNLCDKYINIYSEFYPNIKLNNRKGNDLFSSRNINKGFRGQRSDDIESILYIILYLLDDSLFKELYNQKNIHNIISIKESIFMNTLHEYQFIKLFILEINKILTIEHKKPNYNKLIDILIQAKQ
jgi:serine/threonine protein kinase